MVGTSKFARLKELWYSFQGCTIIYLFSIGKAWSICSKFAKLDKKCKVCLKRNKDFFYTSSTVINQSAEYWSIMYLTKQKTNKKNH